ncbi:MAG: FHA domain-containing protein [Acidobacteriota bacterium]
MIALFVMRGVLLFLTAFACVLPVFGGQQPSLVVAVDSSRSLRASDITEVHDALLLGLDGVSPELAVGLVTFDDTARWLVEPTTDPNGVLEALRVVEPSGTTTVLYDGIFLAAQGMEGGGALMVVSDGKDENSAVTVSDIEGLCSRHDVRLLTVGVGRNIDDKALRRLALLTRGVYLGGSVESVPAGLPGAVETTMASLETGPKPTEVHEEQPSVAQPAPAAEKPVETTRKGLGKSISWSKLMLVGLLGVFLLVGAGVVWWFLNRRGPEQCAVCGEMMPDDGGDCTACQIEAIRTSAENREVADEEATRVPDLGVGAMAFETQPGHVDRTVALGETAVLTVHEEGREAREYTLPRDRIFAVGRAPRVNTLQVRDQTVSAQHFKVVYKDSRYYVVDLWTTNGTSVNHECVRVHPLSTGDIIRAGLSEFVFSSQGGVQQKSGAETAPPPL